MTQRKGSGIEDLILLPWWVSLVFAGLVCIGSRIASAAETSNISTKMVAKMAAEYGPYLAMGLIVISGISALRSWANSRMLDQQAGLDSLRRSFKRRFRR